LINQTKEIPAGSRVVKTAATSDLTRKIAERNGLICEETMMGFRYIGEKAEEYSRLSNHAFFFGYDENCGYATGMEGRVRDGVLAAMLLVEMASFYRCHGISLHSHLKAIYQDFGIYREAMDVFSLDQTGKLEADEIMEAMRLDPPFEGKVIQMIDYLHADTDLPRDNMIKWYLDHAWLAMRPSGDGEKLKCYYSVWAEEEDKAEEGLSLLQDQVRDHMRKAFDK
jgi:phosphoglucomutase